MPNKESAGGTRPDQTRPGTGRTGIDDEAAAVGRAVTGLPAVAHPDVDHRRRHLWGRKPLSRSVAWRPLRMPFSSSVISAAAPRCGQLPGTLGTTPSAARELDFEEALRFESSSAAWNSSPFSCCTSP